MNKLNEIESGDNATDPQSPYSTFKLFVNEKMMRNIQQCNEIEGQMHSEVVYWFGNSKRRTIEGKRSS